MLKQINENIKLLLAFIFISIISITSVAWISYFSGKKSLETLSISKLTAIRETKKRQIETYFEQIRNQCITLSEDYMVINAFKEFKSAFYNLPEELKPTATILDGYRSLLDIYYNDEFLKKINPLVEVKRTVEEYLPTATQSIILQNGFIASNPNPTGSKDNLDTSPITGSYGKVHLKYHPVFRSYLKKFKYYDIFLIDDETGYVLYTVFKEIDFANNLFTSRLKDSNLSELVKNTSVSISRDFIKLINFAPYDPSYSAPAAFIATPLYEGDHKIGVLAMQVPTDQINEYMTDNQRWEEIGLGRTGEAYIVGEDNKMRSISRFLIEDKDKYIRMLEEQKVDSRTIEKIKIFNTTILLQNVITKPVKEALKGDIGSTLNLDYREKAVLSSFAPLKIKDVNWCIISQMDQTEAFEPAHSLAKTIIMWSFLIFLFVILFSYLFNRFIFSSKQKVTELLLPKIINSSQASFSLISQFSKSVDSLINNKNLIESNLIQNTNPQLDTMRNNMVHIEQLWDEFKNLKNKLNDVTTEISIKCKNIKEKLGEFLKIIPHQKKQSKPMQDLLSKTFSDMDNLNLEINSLKEILISNSYELEEKLQKNNDISKHQEQITIELQKLLNKKNWLETYIKQLQTYLNQAELLTQTLNNKDEVDKKLKVCAHLGNQIKEFLEPLANYTQESESIINKIKNSTQILENSTNTITDKLNKQNKLFSSISEYLNNFKQTLKNISSNLEKVLTNLSDDLGTTKFSSLIESSIIILSEISELISKSNMYDQKINKINQDMDSSLENINLAVNNVGQSMLNFEKELKNNQKAQEKINNLKKQIDDLKIEMEKNINEFKKQTE